MRRLMEQDLDYYSTNIKVDLYVDNYDDDVEYDESVLLQYKIELEYRSWGIKSMIFIFDKPIKISYTLEDGTSKEIEVDLSDAEIEYYEGGATVPSDLDIRIDKEGNVLSKTLNVYYLKP